MSLTLLLLMLAGADDGPYTRPPVAEPILAEQRGGFRLPSGIDVAITVQTDTAINGALVLRTVFAADQGAPTVLAYAPKSGQTVASVIPPTGVAASRAGTPTVSYDARTGIQVTPALSTFTARTGATPTLPVPEGLEPVAPGSVTDHGVIADTAGRAVTLRGPDIAITHLTGTALGSAIANAGSDRVIDTQTSVAIDLHGAGPDVVGSAMLRVEDVALGALTDRLP